MHIDPIEEAIRAPADIVGGLGEVIDGFIHPAERETPEQRIADALEEIAERDRDK